MGDVAFWNALWSPATPLWAIALGGFVVAWRGLPAWMQRRNEARRDGHAAKAGDWTRLRDEIARLDERCDHLQREVDECREREGEWMQRAIAAESALIGKGEVKQEAQRIVSADREEQAGKKP